MGVPLTHGRRVSRGIHFEVDLVAEVASLISIVCRLPCRAPQCSVDTPCPGCRARRVRNRLAVAILVADITHTLDDEEAV